MMLIVQFGLYLLLMLGIGYYSMKRTQNNEDFIIGGRSLGPVTTAISAGASDMSSWLLLGLPGAVFAAGLVDGLWISLGLTLGAYCNWLVVAPRLRAYTENLDAVTLPTYLSNRFDDKKKAWISRMGVVGFALIALIITWTSDGSILNMVGYAWGGFGAAFGPLIILSLTWKKTTKAGAIAGMIVGAVAIFVVKNYIKIEGEYFYELLPGFFLAFSAIVLVSLVTAKPRQKTLDKLVY